jgi:diguanylate cyclase (GGDEF)-like protein/PAS domain S-box-containing protein
MLLALLVTSILVVGGAATYITYLAAFEEEGLRLREIAQSQARLLESVARFDAQYSSDFPGGSFAATLGQIREAHSKYKGFGETGEFTLGKWEGDSIVFLLNHRHYDLNNPKPIPFEAQEAEPMRRALQGLSGTLVGYDYRGKLVLAAHEPVDVLGLGIVAKIDLDEVRRPFLEAFGLAVLIGVLVVAIGAWLLMRITGPWVAAIQAAETRYRGTFNQAAVGIARMAPDGSWLAVNQKLCDIVGYTQAELLEGTFQDITHPDDLAADLQRVDEMLDRRRNAYSVEKRYIRKSGEIIWINLTLSLVWKPNGGPDYFISVAEDITEKKRIVASLREAVSFRRSIFNTLPDLVWLKDPDGVYMACNPVFERFFGASEAEIIGKTDYDFVDGDLADKFRSMDKAAIDVGGLSSNEEWVTFSDDGHRALLLTTKTPMFDADHRLVGVLGIGRDITERKRGEELSRLRQELSDLVYSSDLERLMRKALDMAEELTGSQIGFFHFVDHDQETISLQVWSTRTLRDMCFAEGEGLHYPVREAGVWCDCIRQRKPVIHNDYVALQHKKGLPEGHAEVIRELVVPVLRDTRIDAVMGVGNKLERYEQTDLDLLSQIADITYDFVERKQAENKIEYMAFNDVLTGLPNRQLLADRLQQAVSLSQRSGQLLAICYLDLNDFKPVNDRYGHHVGDQLLVQLGKRLQDDLREGDTLARLGGDEFVILLNNLRSIFDGEEIIGRILDEINQPFNIEGHRVHISGSIGVTIFPMDESDADTLIRHADQAMYKAKAEGKATFNLYDPVQNQKLHAHRRALQEFELAVGNGQLLLHYQPRINLKTAEVISMEALVRWQHPEQGLLPPGRFLKMIEGTPQETLLGEWVLRSALDQHMAWRNGDVRLPVSVNISPRHIQMSGFTEFLSDILAEYPQDVASQLELEVLETSAIGDMARVSDIMRDCTVLGVHFSLDDFGTGYSSLTYFHHLPISVLKIDQNFVRSMLDNVQDLDIVEGVLRLAAALQRPVVSEGVESIELGMMLQQLGCQFAQGYGIARPMPPQRVTRWLAEWERETLWHGLGKGVPQATGRFDLDVSIFSFQMWLSRIIQVVRHGDRAELPPMSDKHCQLERWLKGVGKTRYGSHPSFAFIPPKHQQVHELAAEVIAELDAAGQDQALYRTQALQEHAEELVVLLRGLASKH